MMLPQEFVPLKLEKKVKKRAQPIPATSGIRFAYATLFEHFKGE
ncbi:hypothetical protein SAMN05661099_2559 [Daejeonella lutea]|uniref:Uncharacterized protein n=1 Tax=Daejeonella lutea TaxID=572036 RepID=A0A1T5DS99_9SPHI|nr:hypothetical protein SAMN05661099_2559 [Daejeonella lutea]